MDLRLDDDQRLIVESAEAFLADACPIGRVRGFADSGAFDRELWQSMAELGWCGVQLPESAGGLGLGPVALALLQEQLGRRLACVPFFEGVALGATLLHECGTAPEALWSGVADGSQIVVPALPAPGQAPALTARPQGDGWQLDGRCAGVAGAAAAHLLLLPAQLPDGGLAWFALPAGTPGLTIQAVPTVDSTRPLADVSVVAVQALASSCLARGALAQQALQRTQALGAIALAAEQVGVAQQALDLTLAYVRERQQFERPVGSFQAVKHRCAQMLVGVESARSAVYAAACTAEAQPDCHTLLLAVAQARSAATDAALFATREAIQLHGGVGFTWEYDPHLYFRRAQAQAHTLAPVAWWREQVAALLLDTPGAPA